jgi:hypothetical protein
MSATTSTIQLPYEFSWSELSAELSSALLDYLCLILLITRLSLHSLPTNRWTAVCRCIPILFTELATSVPALYSRGMDKAENTVLLLRGAGHTDNMSCDRYAAGSLALWLLHSNELQHSSIESTASILVCCNMFTEPVPGSDHVLLSRT